MRLSRKAKFFTALTALVSIFFMQLAVAAYACPGINNSQLTQLSANPASAIHETMPGCEKMDSAQPALCHAHCKVDSVSLDKPELPLAQLLMAATLIEVCDIVEVSYPFTPRPDLLLSARISAPSLTIQNCCFRV